MKLMRLLAVAVSVALVAVVAWAVVNRTSAPAAGGCGVPTAAVRGIVGSEKEAFLRDPRVVRELACQGLTLTIDPSGSREMVNALSRDTQSYDFAFPSSTPAAEKIKQIRSVDEETKVFSSVMGVATFRKTLETLRAAKVVQTVGGQDVLDIRALIDLARDGTRWNQLPGNESSPNGNAVLLRTTDPRDSSSAMMFISIASAVLNGDAPVAGVDQLPKVMPDLCRLDSYQGQQPNTSQVLFDEYLTDGAARTPIGLVYESQFLDRTLAQKVPDDGEHVMIFPKPTVYSWHTVVPFTDNGRALGRQLRENATLKDLAAEYGFRPEGTVLDDRPTPPTVIEPPSYEVLEAMVDQLSAATGKGCPQ